MYQIILYFRFLSVYQVNQDIFFLPAFQVLPYYQGTKLKYGNTQLCLSGHQGTLFLSGYQPSYNTLFLSQYQGI